MRDEIGAIFCSLEKMIRVWGMLPRPRVPLKFELDFTALALLLRIQANW